MTRRVSTAITFRLRNVLARGASFMQSYGNRQPRSAARLSRRHAQATDHADRAIVVTTFEERQSRFCVPLIAAIRESGCGYPIVVVSNGNRNGLRDTRAFSTFIEKLAGFPDVYPVTFRRMVGLARLWNAGVHAAGAQSNIILNDDLIAAVPGVAADLSRLAEFAETDGLVIGNGSWSHFGISRSIIEDVGWFDERLLGFGEEDGDYAWRYRTILGKYPLDIPLNSLVDLKADSAQEFAQGVGKYSLANRVFSRMKFSDLPKDAPIEREPPPIQRFVTPNFYPGESFRWKCDHLLDESDEGVMMQELRNATSGEDWN
jgi:hypothetical protein